MRKISSADALLIVDVQNDFLPDGALAVPEGDAVIPVINRLMALPFGAVVTTQDWHPAAHCSFEAQGGPWPSHCVADTLGAALAGTLERGVVSLELRKGQSLSVDSYSAFLENDGVTRTILKDWLNERKISRVFVTGLALDYCVTATAIDAKNDGFESVIVLDACRGIAPLEDAVRRAESAGILLSKSSDLS
ncbi:nicotinamidase [Acetobacter sp.]|jgi:nicotinamidase/pyrazinamidase|uniref:nicotinamidase n=1 Tax=Acetobacter sp. TaxID=440 RepID=UPI0025C570B2|nr:nicotinamidase [Acetobacter sp.]MCH4091071.1 nicotinamidase [Acetobacter sp.]MCI1300254.1 nicotinamidase [Acetobacter sp.]MCI1316078.1 nicotinamidase [Acetobacter sp.]